jgi:hypothetical protein
VRRQPEPESQRDEAWTVSASGTRRNTGHDLARLSINAKVFKVDTSFPLRETTPNCNAKVFKVDTSFPWRETTPNCTTPRHCQLSVAHRVSPLLMPQRASPSAGCRGTTPRRAPSTALASAPSPLWSRPKWRAALQSARRRHLQRHPGQASPAQRQGGGGGGAFHGSCPRSSTQTRVAALYTSLASYAAQASPPSQLQCSAP